MILTNHYLSLYFLHNKASLTVQSIALCSQLALDPLFSAMVHVQSYRVELSQDLQLISVLVQAAIFIEQDLYGMRHITDCPIEGQLQPKLGEPRCPHQVRSAQRTLEFKLLVKAHGLCFIHFSPCHGN